MGNVFYVLISIKNIKKEVKTESAGIGSEYCFMEGIRDYIACFTFLLFPVSCRAQPESKDRIHLLGLL